MDNQEQALLEWWLNKDPLTEEEKTALFQERPSTIEENDEKFITMCDKFFDMMPYCNISTKTHSIRCEEEATTFINRLFDKYVDDDTLVICSNNEHDSVKRRQKTSKNVLIINYEEDICKFKINDIIRECKKYKKIFVYIIGTQISNGRITPQKFFIELKQAFIQNNINHILVIDDVHGTFIIPRDYSIFDYVIFTAHALVKKFDMGMLICKKGNELGGIKPANWLEKYYEYVNIVLKRQEKIRMFQTVMIEYCMKYLKYNDFSILSNTAPHIFALVLNHYKFTEEVYNSLNEYYIRLEGTFCKDANKTFIRMRAAQFIKEPEKFIAGLKLLENVLSIYDFK